MLLFGHLWLTPVTVFQNQSFRRLYHWQVFTAIAIHIMMQITSYLFHLDVLLTLLS